MKIRNGFVSNSSSSSFCIMAVEAPEDIDCWNVTKGNDLDYQHGIEEYCGMTLIGFDPDEMKNDETLLQFKQRIVDELKKVGIDATTDDLMWYVDGGYEG